MFLQTGCRMFLTSRWKTVAITIALVFVFVMCLTSYQSSYYPEQKRNPIPLPSTEPDNIIGSSAVKFTFSEQSVFETLLGIRNKNCFALNEFQSMARRSLFCQNLENCNMARRDVKSLPDGCRRSLPKCLIIGVQKSGTRELTDFLSMHPNIVIKSNDYLLPFYTKNWEMGSEWHRQQMPFSFKEQIPLYKENYFFPKEVPERIKLSDPNMKMILIVRNPVDMLVSLYTFRKPETRFRKLANTDLQRNLTLKYRYDEPFERYLRYFNRSQIHVVDSEKFRKDPQSVLFQIETFLNLPHVIKKEDFVFNTDKDFYCLRDINKPVSSCYGDDRGRTKIQDDKTFVKVLLRPLFKMQNERFFNLTGLRFNWG